MFRFGLLNLGLITLFQAGIVAVEIAGENGEVSNGTPEKPDVIPVDNSITEMAETAPEVDTFLSVNRVLRTPFTVANFNKFTDNESRRTAKPRDPKASSINILDHILYPFSKHLSPKLSFLRSRSRETSPKKSTVQGISSTKTARNPMNAHVKPRSRASVVKRPVAPSRIEWSSSKIAKSTTRGRKSKKTDSMTPSGKLKFLVHQLGTAVKALKAFQAVLTEASGIMYNLIPETQMMEKDTDLGSISNTNGFTKGKTSGNEMLSTQGISVTSLGRGDIPLNAPQTDNSLVGGKTLSEFQPTTEEKRTMEDSKTKTDNSLVEGIKLSDFQPISVEKHAQPDRKVNSDNSFLEGIKLSEFQPISVEENAKPDSKAKTDNSLVGGIKLSEFQPISVEKHSMLDNEAKSHNNIPEGIKLSEFQPITVESHSIPEIKIKTDNKIVDSVKLSDFQPIAVEKHSKQNSKTETDSGIHQVKDIVHFEQKSLQPLRKATNPVSGKTEEIENFNSVNGVSRKGISEKDKQTITASDISTSAQDPWASAHLPGFESPVPIEHTVQTGLSVPARPDQQAEGIQQSNTASLPLSIQSFLNPLDSRKIR